MEGIITPCRWWLRWFCRAPIQPCALDWQCTVCKKFPSRLKHRTEVDQAAASGLGAAC
jgi:hypothetical protein